MKPRNHDNPTHAQIRFQFTWFESSIKKFLIKYDDERIKESPSPAYMISLCPTIDHLSQSKYTHPSTFVSIELLFQSIFSKWETFQFNLNKDDRFLL